MFAEPAHPGAETGARACRPFLLVRDDFHRDPGSVRRAAQGA